MMKLLWIDPVGTEVDVVSLPAGRPRHLEYHSYTACPGFSAPSPTRSRRSSKSSELKL